MANYRKMVAEKISLVNYFQEYVRDEDIKLRRKVLCPIHMENTPSFNYFADTDTFMCFGCGRGGSVIELHYWLMWLRDPATTKQMALEDLFRMIGIRLFERFSPDQNLLGGKLPDRYLQSKLEQLSQQPDRAAAGDLLRAFGNSFAETLTLLETRPPLPASNLRYPEEDH